MGGLWQMWLTGRWIPTGYGGLTPVSDSMVDIYGSTLTVGSWVKLIGVVTALNPSDPHFQDITVTPVFPQSGLVSPQAGVFPLSSPVKSYQFHPLQLMKLGTTL